LGDASTLAARLSHQSRSDLKNVTGGLRADADDVSQLERLADVAIYSTDALVRRSPGLQQTADARPPVVSVSRAVWARWHLGGGMPPADNVAPVPVRISQGGAPIVMSAACDPTLDERTVRIPAGHADTAGLGALFGPVHLEKI
jgi:NADH-quinone oxidoreductase subunit G